VLENALAERIANCRKNKTLNNVVRIDSFKLYLPFTSSWTLVGQHTSIPCEACLPIDVTHRFVPHLFADMATDFAATNVGVSEVNPAVTP